MFFYVFFKNEARNLPGSCCLLKVFERSPEINVQHMAVCQYERRNGLYTLFFGLAYFRGLLAQVYNGYLFWRDQV